MPQYHLSRTGQPAVCRAKSRVCPLGGEHFSSLEKATQAAEIADFGKELGIKPKAGSGRERLVFDNQPVSKKVVQVSEDGTVFTMRQNVAGKMKAHSFDDKPAIVGKDGSKQWLRFGRLSRIDGPAVINSTGSYYYHNDQLHRTGGPAVEKADGSKEWWEDGVKHRTDGPAVVTASGQATYWYNGKQYSKQEFENVVIPREAEKLTRSASSQ